MDREVVDRFLKAYDADWCARWLPAGGLLEDTLRFDEHAASTYPRGARQAGDRPEPNSAYCDLLDRIGDCSLELPFTIVLSGRTRSNGSGRTLFIASHHEGRGYWAFSGESDCDSPAIHGYSETGTPLGPVVSSFSAFLNVLTFMLENGGNRLWRGTGSVVWQFVQKDAVARSAPAFWQDVLECQVSVGGSGNQGMRP